MKPFTIENNLIGKIIENYECRKIIVEQTRIGVLCTNHTHYISYIDLLKNYKLLDKEEGLIPCGVEEQ